MARGHAEPELSEPFGLLQFDADVPVGPVARVVQRRIRDHVLSCAARWLILSAMAEQLGRFRCTEGAATGLLSYLR